LAWRNASRQLSLIGLWAAWNKVDRIIGHEANISTGFTFHVPSRIAGVYFADKVVVGISYIKPGA
jgi:hypothetical protein